MDLSELNQQLFALQNDFQQYQPENIQTQNNKFQDINFQPVKHNIDTTQIKRPQKSGDHRNDINDKMNMFNSTYFAPENNNPNSPDMLNKQQINMHMNMPNTNTNTNTNNFQSTRNNSNYVNTLQSTQSRMTEIEPSNQINNFASYYNNNFDTLQTNKSLNTPSQNVNKNNKNTHQQFQSNQQNQSNQSNQLYNNQNSHSGGMSMLNVRNMYSMNNTLQNEDMSNKINDTGYHRIDEKKTDYRQNMNSKLDNMIFDNPGALPINPILQNNNSVQKDTRMVIQDSNKDYYRQSSNDRMSQYSPLSRSSNIPINMANMSVNDFYSNMYSGNSGIDKNLINEEHNKINSKEMLNNRINNFAPLAKTIQYKTNETNETNRSNDNKKTEQRQALQSKTPQTQTPQTQTLQYHAQKQVSKQWDPSDVNGKLQNVYHNSLPIFSNSERA